MNARTPHELLASTAAAAASATADSPAVPNARVAVLLLHGLCSTPDETLSLQAGLRVAGFSVHTQRIDGYSFDAAATAQRESPWASWLDQLQARIGELRLTHDRVVLAGISAGASLALGAATRCPVDGLVLMSTSLKLDGWSLPPWHFLLPVALYTPAGRFWRYREAPPYGVKNERIRAFIAAQLTRRRVSSAGAAVLGVGHLRENHRLIRFLRRNLGRVQCPNVLALHAREDEVASVANLDLLEQGLAPGTLRTSVMENSYHMITLDNDRQQVARESVAFVRELAASA